MQFMQTMESGGSSRGKNRRRREGEDHVATNSVKLGDVIYIKLRGGSWWPAQAVDENSVSESSKPRKKSAAEILVRIYGSCLYLYADPIKSHCEFEEILKQNNNSYKEILLQALEQDLPRTKLSRSSGSRSKTKANVRKTSKESGKLKDLEANSSKAQKNARRSSDQNNVESTSEVDEYINGEKERSNNSGQDEPPITARSLRPRENLKQRIPNAKKEDKGKSPKQCEVKKELIVGKKRQPSQTGERPISGIESLKSPSKRNGALNGNDLSDQRTPSDSSTRRKRVMENLGLSPPPGSPFQRNGGKGF
ncbi:hypothetical protein L6164_015998 [Bauhinia variegata]|uniref:Uncharacterized protein n=1 Tax=Bauhinia variegata TaxID=167791 RepID=A0ACB9NM20_BAUVA|nr:hypothetical protein L6164_015998 [Bauhinia variegata]